MMKRLARIASCSKLVQKRCGFINYSLIIMKCLCLAVKCEKIIIIRGLTTTTRQQKSCKKCIKIAPKNQLTLVSSARYFITLRIGILFFFVQIIDSILIGFVRNNCVCCLCVRSSAQQNHVKTRKR